MRHVVQVTEYKLQRVLPGRQFKRCLRLASPEVQMVVVGRKAVHQFLGPIFALSDRRSIDQEVMMPGLFLLRTGWSDAHAFQTEHDRHR